MKMPARIMDMKIQGMTLRKIAVVVILIISMLAVLNGCEDEQDPITAELPVFSVTPVDLTGPYDPADSTFGDVKFIDPVLLPFGAVLDIHHLSPAIEYYTDTGAAVRVVCDGVVAAILENPISEGDYEVHVTALPGSDYTIIYDHILRVNMLKGELVYPGDTIGWAGNWTDKMRRTGLQVNVGEGSDTRSYCPLNFGDSDFLISHRALLQEYTHRGFTPAYDTLCLSSPVRP